MAISIEPFERQFGDFGEAIRTGRKPLVGGEEGLQALEIVEAVYKSCRTAKRWRWAESMSWTSLRVPASSANLGPGFDALGLALGIHLDCRFRPGDKLSITVTGRDCETISTGEDNLIWQTALAVAADTRSSIRPIELQVDNQIPVGKGLGSSAAALTAGVVIADRSAGAGLEASAHSG